MSGKIDLEPLDKENANSSLDITSLDSAVSNGLDQNQETSRVKSRRSSSKQDSSSNKSSKNSQSKQEISYKSPVSSPVDLETSVKSPGGSLKESSEKSGNMTNKDIPIKPSQRSRMRSRSKSSNSEDMKKDKPSDDPNPAPNPSQPSVEEKTSKQSDDILKLEIEAKTASSSATPMEVDESDKKVSESDEPGPSETISTPLIVEDEDSSDFNGFSSPEDKYPAFSVVLRPYEEAVAVRSSKGNGSQNGLMNPVVKIMPLSPRIYRSSPSSKIDIYDPEYRKPFQKGWRRELVFRSTNDSTMKRNADVYYYTPNNKKVRSLREVLEHLIPGQGLTAENFTFFKESLGLDDPEKEIIREANFKSSRPSEEGFYTLPLKKSVTPKKNREKVKKESIKDQQIDKPKSKTKEKKEVFKEQYIELSPSSPPGTSTGSPITPRIVMKPGFKVNSKKISVKAEKKRKSAGPDDPSQLDSPDDWCREPKAQVREVCSIECRLAMGLIPTLQCVKCLCLFHPECVNLPEAKERQIHSYVCKYCQNAAKLSSQVEQNRTSKLPPPPPLTPIVSPPAVPKKDKESPKATTTTPVPNTNANVVSTRNPSIVGAVTTWLPPSSSIQVGKGPPPIAPRPELESSPQSLISVQGKKFVVIPKLNRVKLDGGRNTEGGGDEMLVSAAASGAQTPNPAGVYLVPYNPTSSGTYAVQSPTSTAPTYIVTSASSSANTTLIRQTNQVDRITSFFIRTNGLKRGASDTGSGSDGSPPAKMSAVSPKSAPIVKQVGVPKPAPKVVPTPKQGSAKSPAQPSAPVKTTTITPHQPPPIDFMNFLNAGYIALLHSFQYLKVHELLRAACVSKMWRDISTHRSLWETVKMKNSRVRNWEGFGRSLRNNGTRCLDLKKMLVPDNSEAVAEMWRGLVRALKTVPTLEKLDVGRCTADNLDMISKACPQLQSIVALSIRGHSLDLNIFFSESLVELKLKSVGGMELSNFSSLKKLVNLKILSLTSIKKLTGLEDCLPKSLESLELGECCEISESFATGTLPTLRNLSRLRLEKGQGSCPTLELIGSISGLEKLSQLELVNFDIKPGFDKVLAKCIHVKTLLVIPTYVTQSATTNHVVMGGVTKLSATLEYFIWGLTLELLRVTDLFIDQVEGQKKVQAKKGSGDSIPILKPLADDSPEPAREGQTTSQVDILALPKLQKVLSTLLPTTRVKILKVPFSATWRQTVD